MNDPEGLRKSRTTRCAAARQTRAQPASGAGRLERTSPGPSRARMAVTLTAVLLTAACTNVPQKGPKTGSNLPPHLDASAGQLLRYCQRIRETGDLATAAGLCERAHRMDPSSPAPLMEVASILTEMGELDLAVSAYRTLLHHSPDDADAHYALGRTYVAQGRYDRALAEFRWVLQGQPGDAALYNAVGVVNDLMGAHAEAQEAFKRGLNRAPRDARLRNNLGLSLVRSGRYDEGVAVLASLAQEPQADQSTKDNLQLALGLSAEARIETMARAGEAEARTEAAADTDAVEVATIPSTPAAPSDHAVSQNEGETSTAAAVKQPASATRSPHDVDPDTPTPLAGAFTAEPSEEYEALDAGESGYDFYTATHERTAASREHAGASADGLSASAVSRQTATVGAADIPSDGAADGSASADQAVAGLSAERTAKAGSHAIQFASYTKAEDAKRGWKSIRAAAPDLLADIEPNVASADLGAEMGGTFYRLRTSPTSRAEAKQLCANLTARGVDCLVVSADSGGADAPIKTDPTTL